MACSRDEARAQLREMGDRRRRIEEEMEALTETLSTTGAGVSGKLVDAEGFPRADIDVHQTLIHRNRMAVLQTDHKDIMAQIEKMMPIAFAKPQPGDTTAPPPVEAAPEPEPSGMAVPVPLASTAPSHYTPAFALIDEVAAAGPAAAAGLRVGDELISFGGLKASDLRSSGRLNLQPLALKVRDSEGSVLAVVVQRAGQYHELSLTPMAWEGQGLLGCHLQPL